MVGNILQYCYCSTPLQHIYLDEQYIFNESKRLYIVHGIKFQFNHSMYVGIEAYTDTVILEDLHLYAYFIRLHIPVLTTFTCIL